MTVEETQKEEQASEAAVSVEEFSSELREPRWSVISFEKNVASGLSYTEAEQKLKQLEAENVAGLCVVTDEAAARISEN